MQEPIALLLMAEETKITLKYDGPSVRDGTLPLDDVVNALQGFSGAYNKISRLRGDEVEHELRVSAVQTGSFELVILAWIVLGQTPGAIQGLEAAYDAVRWVIERIFSMIEVKKHAKSKPLELSIKGDNNTVAVINAEGAKLSIPIELMEVVRTKLLDADLNKIVSPLEADRVNSAEIIAETKGKTLIREAVNSSEREYFRPTDVVTTKESEITGKFVSLNKQNNRGTFELGNGKHVPYRYSGPDPDKFHMQFGRKGPIRVEGVATFDENLEPTHIEVKDVQHLQGELPLTSESN